MINRRQFIVAASALSPGLAGCSSLGGENEDDIQDSDGDGMIDSQDYAPRDPEVQERSDLNTPSPTPSPTESEPWPTYELSGIQDIDSMACQLSIDDLSLDGADRVEIEHQGEIIGRISENGHTIFHQIDQEPTFENGQTLTVYGVWNGERHWLAEDVVVCV